VADAHVLKRPAALCVNYGRKPLSELSGRLEVMPQPTLIPVESREDFDALLDASSASTALLFLHDWTCPISSRAEDQVMELEGTIHTVDVTTQHDLNRYIAQRTGVRHESPQFFILRGGSSVYDASHGRIRADVISALLEEHETSADRA
jgi:bacillithiol system protein YtxJ